MTFVNQLLKIKGHGVLSVPPEASLQDALNLMADRNIGALLVLDGGDVVGIFSERDYARKVMEGGSPTRELLVKDYMTAELIYVRPDQSVEDCMALMTEKRVRHLTVLDENKLAGVISIGDVVKSIISDQEFMIKQLKNYIAGD